MDDVDTEVLIAGAGPTGLTLACVLAQWGVAVRVVDAAPESSRGSRAKGLQPRSLEVFDGLGIAGRVIARGRFRMPLRRYVEVDDRVGAPVDVLPGAEPAPGRPWTRGLLVPQFRVEEALRARLGELGVVVERGRAVTGVEQDGGVAVALADGSSVTARYLVGCDGGSSAVRRLLGVPFLGETHDDVRMLLADVVVDGLDRDHWHQFGVAAERRFAMLCPLPSTDTFQLQAAVPPGREDAEPTLAVLQEVVDGVTRGVTLREVVWASRWRLNVRMVERYRVGAVFLAGDAAHVHSPAGAQGMNTGIQDAANLGWKLASVLGGADPGLLDTYEAERLPVAADVLGLSTLLSARPFDRRGPEGERTSQLGVTYRGGPLAVDPGEGPARPGDRAPDAPGHAADRTPVRLFELYRPDPRPHWTLLGFGAVPPPVDGPVRGIAIGDGFVDGFVDTGGHARDAYAPFEGELVAVRPDGHVGARGAAADVVASLRGILPVPVGV